MLTDSKIKEIIHAVGDQERQDGKSHPVHTELLMIVKVTVEDPIFFYHVKVASPVLPVGAVDLHYARPAIERSFQGKP